MSEQQWPEGTKPLVSVICTTYNHAAYIRDAIEGFLNQETTFPVEIIVHDDASTDGTAEIIQAYKDRHPEVVVPILQERNLYSRGLDREPYIFEKVRGHYIALCEGDDYWHRPDKLEKQVRIFDESPNTKMVVSDFDVIDKSGGRRASSVNKRVGRWDPNSEAMKDVTLGFLRGQLIAYICTVCIPFRLLKDVLEQCDYRFTEKIRFCDLQLGIEVSRLGSIHYIDESLATYRVLPVSACHTGSAEGDFNWCLNCLRLNEHYAQKFGYGDEMLGELRHRHFFALAHLILRRRAVSLRERLLGLGAGWGIAPGSRIERFLYGALATDGSFQCSAALYPVLSLWTRGRGFFARKIKLRLLC